MRGKLLIALFSLGIVAVIGVFLLPGRTWILWYQERQIAPETRDNWEKLSAYPLYLMCIWAAEDKTKTLYENSRHNKARYVTLHDNETIVFGGEDQTFTVKFSCWPETVDPRR